MANPIAISFKKKGAIRHNKNKKWRKPINLQITLESVLYGRGIEPQFATAYDIRRAAQSLGRRIGIVPAAEAIVIWNEGLGRKLGSPVEVAPEWCFPALDAALASRD